MTQPARRALCALIERYQARGGGAHYFGIDCNFTPTCSEYTRQAVAAQGVWRGLSMAWHRIRRCNRRDLPHRTHDPFMLAPSRSPCSKP